ncbi:MAG: hypothetical protein IH951_11605 [Bacteroidetes bacterium]|nr:hypothetical protein [Bacteroidota bacterium]
MIYQPTASHDDKIAQWVEDANAREHERDKKRQAGQFAALEISNGCVHKWKYGYISGRVCLKCDLWQF